MYNPFKVGDKIYHVRHGRGKIVEFDESDIPLRVDFGGLGIKWVGIELSSFTPWPEPNHVRPFEAVLKKGQVVIVRPNDGGVPFTITVVAEFENSIQSGAQSSWPKSQFTFHHIGSIVQFN